MEKNVIIFSNKKIRRIWHEEDWWFSIVDIVEILTESSRPRKYWSDLKQKLIEEGFQLSDFIGQLKMMSDDGKKYMTDCANMKGIFRIIQSIPSKKAEPFKIWLAKTGKERLDETEDPELTIDRAIKTYLQKGYSKDWINQRIKTIEVRKQLTDEWSRVGIEKQSDYAILTNEIIRAWSGKTIQEYKTFKNLKKENLRDNMTNIELILNMLAEATTKEISEKENPKTFQKSKEIAIEGGETAKVAKNRIEKRLKEKVVTSKNAKDALKFSALGRAERRK